MDGIFRVAIVGNITALNFTQPEGVMSVLFAHGSCQGSLYPRPDSMGFEGFQFINTTDRSQTRVSGSRMYIFNPYLSIQESYERLGLNSRII